jgi:general secretion pathway protein K
VVREFDEKGDEGIALIAVLWALVLLSIIAAALSLQTRSGTRIARNMTESAALRAAADAGIQRAILELSDARFSGALDTVKLRPDGTVYAWRFANRIVHYSIQGELGKVNLNQAPQALLVSLFGLAGVDPTRAQSLAGAVADFRDEDNLKRLNGAEGTDYRTAGLAWGPKNAPFETVEELQQVLGMTPPMYARLAPYLTTYSLGFAVDTNVAPERLIEMLHRAGFRNFVESHGGFVFTIRAEAQGSDGGMFVREAVVQLKQDSRIRFLGWRQL